MNKMSKFIIEKLLLYIQRLQLTSDRWKFIRRSSRNDIEGVATIAPTPTFIRADMNSFGTNHNAWSCTACLGTITCFIPSIFFFFQFCRLELSPWQSLKPFSLDCLVEVAFSLPHLMVRNNVNKISLSLIPARITFVMADMHSGPHPQLELQSFPAFTQPHVFEEQLASLQHV